MGVRGIRSWNRSGVTMIVRELLLQQNGRTLRRFDCQRDKRSGLDYVEEAARQGVDSRSIFVHDDGHTGRVQAVPLWRQSLSESVGDMIRAE